MNLLIIVIIAFLGTFANVSGVHFHLDSEDLPEHNLRFQGTDGQKRLKRLTELRKSDKSQYLDQVFKQIESHQDSWLSDSGKFYFDLKPFEGGAEAEELEVGAAALSNQDLVENPAQNEIRTQPGKPSKPFLKMAAETDAVFNYIIGRDKKDKLFKGNSAKSTNVLQKQKREVREVRNQGLLNYRSWRKYL